MTQRMTVYGLMAEFLTAQEILDATRSATLAGYRDIDAYTPYPVEGLALALGLKNTRIPFVVLIGGLVGACVAYGMQQYAMAIDYPLNVGGRPLNSWPLYIPISFEVLIFVASFSALFGMFYVNGLPMPHHPLFNVDRFARASQDRFFLCIEATDPKFDRLETATFLKSLNPHGELMEVPEEANPEAIAETERHLDSAPPITT